jgi:hypothetical protein
MRLIKIDSGLCLPIGNTAEFCQPMGNTVDLSLIKGKLGRGKILSSCVHPRGKYWIVVSANGKILQDSVCQLEKGPPMGKYC